MSDPTTAVRPVLAESAPDPAAPNADIVTLPFERALAELEEIVRRLEQGSVSLEDSIIIYERGEALKRHCDALLKSAEMRIEKITLGHDGKPTGTAPLDVE
ncbi:MAG: exodeoxyribonuclease VII small subunit [Methylobacteriaceae bacterium]|nr:exodeoxyribonuclease VII small subunit [Methylobacteriaceae bacterium]MBV9221154.1 exodeoxyribonuclease VII small subunit [Methylobacteriaceae bacterium]MBV9246526.1 exodeoxyribonuclease VII small subunit [Methylobacteriaceae bacterium]MBV9634133.1 exodeoxyribonuclease VII small subunit [Methylobacteriaceae bacterium]MBV9703292.1 exodeoxyribonuclease VII small subunit [Methylobacteriaceae bacterium]